MTTAPVANESTAKKAISHTRSVAIGLPAEELKRRKWDGTHPDRHIGPEATGNLQWPEPEVDALGDWAPRQVSGATRGQRSGRSRSAIYKPRAERADVVASRRRFMAACRAFIKHAGGYDALTYDMSWGDIIPRTPPTEELRQFYGPSWSVNAPAP